MVQNGHAIMYDVKMWFYIQLEVYAHTFHKHNFQLKL